MRFASLSIVKLLEVDFTVLQVYETDQSGISHIVGEVIKPYTNLIEIRNDLAEMLVSEIETDNKEIYRDLMLILVPAVYRYEIKETKRAVKANRNTLIEVYNLRQAKTLPKWRLFLIDLLEKTIQKLKGTKK